MRRRSIVCESLALDKFAHCFIRQHIPDCLLLSSTFGDYLCKKFYCVDDDDDDNDNSNNRNNDHHHHHHRYHHRKVKKVKRFGKPLL